MKEKVPTPLLMTEEYWRYTHLSIVRHYGSIKFNGAMYVLVDKDGRDLFECSHEAEKLGREKAIPEGEPCDLIWFKLKAAYKRLKRDRILQLLEEGKTFDEIDATEE